MNQGLAGDMTDLEEEPHEYLDLYNQNITTWHWSMISSAVPFSNIVNWDTFSLRIVGFFPYQV
jgi:hypothetical protein